MPVEGRKSQKTRKPRRFPPSLAGSCLRYAVMDVLGFGRLIEPDSLSAMQAGSAQHKRFQNQLLNEYAMAAVEVPLKDEAWGVSGRMDAVLETERGPWVLEYKTVAPEKFHTIQTGGPLINHWAQLQLYLAVGDFVGGSLVVDSRPEGQRVVFHADPDMDWHAWIRARVARVQSYQATRKLPEREISLACQACDRWQRCFRTAEERDAAVALHPEWEPDPALPAKPRVVASRDIV
ncbi:PD-(D/E)XK nuclease family protein [Sulfobacillus harzensis]|uniref:PD-(D/E)XK endonuclease-like domain-containing protein n=1 Tax=Sulfobacillus harzensis TaxID=2729629 RepID=A0A7Y0L2I1_9FIRM|nr:PD-(D/E)XK nuclease family protein [Sulfobacillus harzensis]NMP22107.1 hypothetical protein [Sulfobacillus harzensis]